MADVIRISPALTTERVLAVVSVAEVKAQLRVTHDREDSLIAGYIAAAYDYLAGEDGWLGGYCPLQQEFEAHFPGGRRSFELPLRPVRAVDVLSVTGVPQHIVLDGRLFTKIEAPSIVGLASNARAVTVRFRAGHDIPADVPAGIRKAILLLAADQYQNREASALGSAATAREIEFGLRKFAGRYRISPDHS
ncbi:head-tail connector protein [Pseudochelatococcus sp. B33]